MTSKPAKTSDYSMMLREIDELQQTLCRHEADPSLRTKSQGHADQFAQATTRLESWTHDLLELARREGREYVSLPVQTCTEEDGTTYPCRVNYLLNGDRWEGSVIYGPAATA